MPNTVSPTSALTILNTSASTVYLDVRTPEEFSAGHPPGAVNVPVLVSGMPVASFVLDVQSKLASVGATSSSIIVGCKSGKRSTMAINLLLEHETFKDRLTELEGGFDNWQTAGLPTENN